MSEAEFAEYIRDQIAGNLEEGDCIMSAPDEDCFIYVDVENQEFWRITVSKATVS